MRNDIGKVRVVGATVAAGSGGAVFVPGSVVASSRMAGDSCRRSHCVAFFFSVNCRGSRRGTVTLLGRIFRRSGEVLGTSALRVNVHRFTRGSIHVTTFPEITGTSCCPICCSVVSGIGSAFSTGNVSVPCPRHIICMRQRKG